MAGWNESIVVVEALIIQVNEETIQSKIYIVRGQKVMLDVDLA